MDRATRERWLIDHDFHNVDAIVGAAEQQDRPTIQRCCAMLMEESMGDNIYQEGAPRLGGQQCTKENYEGIYVPDGMVNSVGIGPCQLTSSGVIAQANHLGGVWNAYCNCRVGFRFLHELIERFGVWGGFRSYNGGDQAAEAYANRAISNERHLIEEGLR
jgi:hypothetical protein